MITSTSNQRIKEIVQLQKKNRARNTEGVFIVEGIRMVREIPEDKLKALYVTEEFYKKHKAELPGNVKPEFVTPTVFSYIADTKTPQGVLAIVWQNKYTLADILKKGTEKKEMLLVLDNLQDPGNLGTIFRTAEAAGVTGIILSKDSVDTLYDGCNFPYAICVCGEIDRYNRRIEGTSDSGLCGSFGWEECV